MNEREYEFTLVLDSRDYDAAEKAIADAGCTDALVGLRYGCIFVDFCRTAPSLLEAILAAMTELSRVNLCVRRVDSCGVVSQAEIASRIGRSRQLVSQYVQGSRGPGNFPPPVCHIDDDHAPLWNWCEVAQWLFDNQLTKREILDDALVTDVINNILDFEYQKVHQRSLFEQIKNRVTSLNCDCAPVI